MAMVIAVQETMGLRALWQEMTSGTAEVHIFSDASAALGAAERLGLMKFRNTALKWMFLKELVRRKEITLHKIGTPGNCADFLTKAVPVRVAVEKKPADLKRFDRGTAELSL